MVMICGCSSIVLPQTKFQVAWQSSQREYTADKTPDSYDDPGYKLYKEGYDLVLDEQWVKARKIFDAMISKYPKSSYVDDAEYWTAYALKHTDRKKAIEAYDKFIKVHQNSSYYDDAIADLSELKNDRSKVIEKLTVKGNARVYITDDGMFMSEGAQRMNIGEDGVVIGEGPESLVVGKHGITITGDGKSFHYSYGLAPQAKTIERAIKLHSVRLNRLRAHAGGSIPFAKIRTVNEENLDPETRLKMEVIYSLGDLKENEKSFKTLKEIALNYKQAFSLREAAMDVLSDFKKFDVASVYIDIIKHDTSEEMQTNAIDYICQHEGDKNKTATILINLFNALPKSRSEQRQMIFYSIADVGNDRAIDFLSNIARKSEDYDLRREAIYYLRNIGGEKVREVLFDIIKEK
jgi:hypothetical protein